MRNKLLRDWSGGPGAGKGRHVLQVPDSKALHLRELGPQILGEPANHTAAPPLPGTFLAHCLPDGPVQLDNLGVDPSLRREACLSSVIVISVARPFRTAYTDNQTRPAGMTTVRSRSHARRSALIQRPAHHRRPPPTARSNATTGSSPRTSSTPANGLQKPPTIRGSQGLEHSLQLPSTPHCRREPATSNPTPDRCHNVMASYI